MAELVLFGKSWQNIITCLFTDWKVCCDSNNLFEKNP